MKTTRTVMSYHARIERADRLTYIAMNVGFGEVVLEHKSKSTANRIECITDTGVLIVKASNGAIITAYVPSIDKVMAIYRQEGYSRIPTQMMTKITKNAKHQKMQDKVKY